MVVSVVFFHCLVGWFLGVCGVGGGVFVFVVACFFLVCFKFGQVLIQNIFQDHIRKLKYM